MEAFAVVVHQCERERDTLASGWILDVDLLPGNHGAIRRQIAVMLDGDFGVLHHVADAESLPTEDERAVLHSREGMTGILGSVYQSVQSNRLVATTKDLDNLDFMTYGPMGPVATLADIEKEEEKDGFTRLV